MAGKMRWVKWAGVEMPSGLVIWRRRVGQGFGSGIG